MHSNDVRVDEKNTANKLLDEAKAMATMLHEMGHVLGIDHSKEADSCMHEALDVQYKTNVGDSDKREFNSTSLDWNANLQTVVATVPGGFRYTVDVHWASGGEGALVQLLTGGAPISDLALPAGWELYDYGSPSAILTFRLDPTDNLQAYLSAAQSTEVFAFTSPIGPSTITGWAGTDQLLLGPQVPEPGSSWLMLSLVPFALQWSGRGRKRHFVRSE
jgi:matrixin